MKQLNTRYNFDEDINRRAVPALKVHPMVLGTKSEGLFAAGVADMDFKAPQCILDALQTRLDHGVFGYEAVRDGLIPALTGWLSTRHDWHIEDSSVLRAPNVLNSLAIATSLFSERGDGVIVQPPVFFDFYDIIRENHRSVVENPLIYKDGHYEIDFDDLEQRASFSRNKILFLCNPHNPIGRVWTKAELLRIGEICNQHNVLVVSDEIHGDITYLDHKYIPFGTLGSDYSNNSISLISPAKSFNIASCCCSFTIIADDTKRNRFQSENSRLTVNKNNAFANAAMEAAYRDGGDWLDSLIEYLQDNLNLLRTKLSGVPQIKLVEPEGTFLVWLDFRSLGLSATELKDFLKDQAGWAVTSGQSFGHGGEGFARVNIACTQSRLEKALNKLRGAVLSA